MKEVEHYLCFYTKTSSWNTKNLNNNSDRVFARTKFLKLINNSLRLSKENLDRDGVRISYLN